MSWKKMPPIEAGRCLPMAKHIAVGFGAAYVTRDGVTVWQEPRGEINDCWTVQRAEEEAMKDPDHDWRIHLVAALYEGHFQRQSPGEWVLYQRGEGFA